MASATTRARLGRVVPGPGALTTRPQPLHKTVALPDLECSPTKLSIATSEIFVDDSLPQRNQDQSVLCTKHLSG